MERKTRLRNFAALQKTRYGRGMDVEQSGRCCCGFLTRVDQVRTPVNVTADSGIVTGNPMNVTAGWCCAI